MKGCEGHGLAADPIHIDLHHEVPDYPQVSRNLDLRYYHVERTLNENPGYCPGQHTIPESLATNAIWEGFETALMMQILEEPGGYFVDFGANIGWYTVIAGKLKHPVIAIEADEVIGSALAKNVEVNNIADYVQICDGWVGPDTEELDTHGMGAPIRLLKSDVEGAEGEVMRVCYNLFNEGMVEYAILELTPVFTTWDYVKLMLDRTMDCGYELRIMPDKGFDVIKFANDPMRATLEHDGKIDKDQVMGLLIRKDLL